MDPVLPQAAWLRRSCLTTELSLWLGTNTSISRQPQPDKFQGYLRGFEVCWLKKTITCNFLTECKSSHLIQTYTHRYTLSVVNYCPNSARKNIPQCNTKGSWHRELIQLAVLIQEICCIMLYHLLQAQSWLNTCCSTQRQSLIKAEYSHQEVGSLHYSYFFVFLPGRSDKRQLAKSMVNNKKNSYLLSVLLINSSNLPNLTSPWSVSRIFAP